MKKKRLTIKEKKFVKSVAKSGNQTEATKEVYNVSSHASAKALGSKLMTKDHIKAAVEYELAQLETTGVKWLQEAMAAPIGQSGDIDLDGRPAMSWEDKRKWLETGAKLGAWGNQTKAKGKDVTPPTIKRPD